MRDLLPRIVELRRSIDDPVTMYINSNGGYPTYGDAIISSLKAPNQEGKIPRLITVVTGYANSTAADMLIYGDYAIAYPESTIHCHGARYYLSEDDALTVERARLTGQSLTMQNEEIALHLAKHIVYRTLFVFLNLRSEFEEIRKIQEPSKLDDVECFAISLFKGKGISENGQVVLSKAIQQYREIKRISDKVWMGVRINDGDSSFCIQTKLLRQIINIHLKGNVKQGPKVPLNLPLDKISEQFRLIIEDIIGPHNNYLSEIIERWGKFFLRENEPEEYERQPEEEKQSWLIKFTKSRIQPLLFFAFSICRLLHEAENRLSATDAYWLGIIDEISGSKLPNLRILAENPPSA